MCATIREFEKWRSTLKESARGYLLLFIVYKHVLLWFWLNTLCPQSFIHIARTICELYWHMWSIMYSLGLFVVVYSEQLCLQTKEVWQVSSGEGYLHFYKVLFCYGWNLKKKMMIKNPYHSPIHLWCMTIPILSTTVLFFISKKFFINLFSFLLLHSGIRNSQTNVTLVALAVLLSQGRYRSSFFKSCPGRLLGYCSALPIYVVTSLTHAFFTTLNQCSYQHLFLPEVLFTNL